MAAAFAQPRRAASAGLDPLSWAAVLVALPTLLPLGSAVGGLLGADRDTLQHLAEYVLPEAGLNTLWLLLMVGGGCAVLGTALAALVELTEFPGRRWLGALLVLPLALPGYVLAVALIGLFDYSGPLASALRAGGLAAWPEFRSRGGLGLCLILVLYPYVYLLAREAFRRQGGRVLEAARALGMGPLRAFCRAALPLARPWIAGGSLLVMMEVLADFGTVSAFNVATFSTAIYKAWFALFSLPSALAVAALMLGLVVLIAQLEQRARRRQRYALAASQPAARIALRPLPALLALGLCVGVLVLALLLPLARLIWLALPQWQALDARAVQAALASLSLGAMAAAWVVVAALVLALAQRQRNTLAVRAAVRLGTLGYALPGALLAVGLYVPAVEFSNRLALAFGSDLRLHGGLTLLLIAYLVCFVAVAHAPIASALQQLRPSLVEAARSLGLGPLRVFAHVFLPLIRGGAASAALLVLVDVIKEMPMTLMMRPFGWDTLATRVFELTSEGLWAQAAQPALAIVAVGLLPVLLLGSVDDAPRRAADHGQASPERKVRDAA